MELFVKSLFCIGCLTSVSSAIGVPIVLTTQSNKELDSRQIKEGGGRLTPASIDFCNFLDRGVKTPMSFGSEIGDKVCGQVESGEQFTEGIADFTDLFRKQGILEGEDWNKNDSRGRDQCLEQSDSGSLTSSDGVKYLGLCSSNKVEETKFFKRIQEKEVLKDNKEKGNIGICEKNCFDSDESTLGAATKMLQEKENNKSNWKKVQFYKN